MEGMRDIARSHYKQASEAEKKSIKEFFKEVDVDGDGEVSHAELKKSVSLWLQAEAVFEKLDENGDGCLDFDEFLCLHYMEKKVDISKCDGCCELLVGPYFSCLLCIRRCAPSYDLCCSCYRHAADLPHHHSSDNMVDHHSLIMHFKKWAADAKKSQHKKEMEEVGEIAKAHYRAGSSQVKALAHEFFQSMDSDGDGRVDRSEFLAFMRERGFSDVKSPNFFDALDLDGNGTLDFTEVMTLYYVIKSGRPFCDCCRKFIPGIFFSCVHCFKINPNTTFDLCLDCYRTASCDHIHDGQTQFLDNYTLLQAMRDPALSASGVNLNHQAQNRPTNAIVQHSATYNIHIHTVPHDDKAIVRATRKTKLELRTASLQLAATVGTIANTLCTIL